MPFLASVVSSSGKTEKRNAAELGMAATKNIVPHEKPKCMARMTVDIAGHKHEK